MRRNEPLKLSASAVKAFLGCPYRYARDYLDRLPDDQREPVPSFAFGNAVHNALADFIRQGGWRALTVDDLVGLLVRHWECGAYPDSDIELDYFHQGREMVTRFYDHPYPASVAKELGVEQYVSWRAARKGLIAAGKLDRACLLPGNVLEIVDYKTGRWMPKEEDLRRDLQTVFYRTLAAERFGGYRTVAIKVTYFYLSVGEAVSVEFEQEDFLARWREIESIALEIRDRLELLRGGQTLVSAFPLNRSRGCARCPMHGHCDRLADSAQKEGT